ncbi:MAG: hypothetical protein H6738_12000 [Alphaproteobacteria bacterium]|nr:hypothetical protein [Alphaproteobacteria bacterium]MCB9697495.1 hypothetical protein [Alphaproteobacteria bacterium]
MTFKLDPRSTNSTVLEAYIREVRDRKKARVDAIKEKYGGVSRDAPEIDEEDEIILNEIWDRIRRGEEP